MKNIILRLLKSMSAMSLGIAVLAANSTSLWIIHQPEVPKGLSKLKKRI